MICDIILLMYDILSDDEEVESVSVLENPMPEQNFKLCP